MSKVFYVCFVMVLAMSACKTSTYDFFGDEFEPVSQTSFEDMVAQIEVKDTVVTAVAARVESVCQTKGCWMNLSPLTRGSEPMVFVKFKDYGFFVPKDIAGREVIVQGKAYKEVTTVDELRHYAEDEGKSQEEIAEITEPVEELKFMASGVALKKL